MDLTAQTRNFHDALKVNHCVTDPVAALARLSSEALANGVPWQARGFEVESHVIPDRNHLTVIAHIQASARVLRCQRDVLLHSLRLRALVVFQDDAAHSRRDPVMVLADAFLERCLLPPAGT